MTRMKKLILLLLSFQCSLYNISLAQQPGELDLSFGTSGLITTSAASWVDVAIQPDGKVLAVSNKIGRYETDGTLDGTFGINGLITIEINDTIYRCNAINIQPDGKILVAGEPWLYGSIDSNFLLIRYNPDGSLDSSFDGDGYTKTDFYLGSNDHGYELAIQTDGKIIVAGSSDTKLALSRYDTNGSLDSTFDNDGKLVINSVNVDFYNLSHATYMKLQIDGKILVGSADNLARLNADGSLDNTFGINGVVGLPQPMRDMAIQPNGKITLTGGGGDVTTVRLDTNGDLDNNFGIGGVTTTDWWVWNCSNPHLVGTSIALQPDGRILAGGYNVCCQLGDCREFILIRYDQDGSIDSSFGSDGMVITSFPQFWSQTESHASAITPDLKIILAGHTYYDSDNGCLARYHLGDMLDVNDATGSNEQFIISPNPTSDRVNIHASDVENGQWHFELRDITGRLILQESILASGRAINKSISLHHLPEGIYLLQLDNGKERTVSRVVKM